MDVDEHPARHEPDDGIDAASPLVSLVAEGIERMEREGPAAIDELCREHPEHADVLRRRLAALGLVGLIEHGPSGDRYRVVRTLGRGGMGVVHLAHDEKLQRHVALKALPARMGLSPNALRRFKREIEAVAKLQHPGIVPIYDVGDEAGTPYFTMEYVEGRTLAEVIDELCELGISAGSLSGSDLSSTYDGRTWTAAVADLVAAVADGLEHAHQQGVVHRDVKPSNILLDGEGRPRLFDFGLARVTGQEAMTLTGDLAGTPFYASPEQVAGRGGTADPRTDVYSLGVTLYELLTLERPFTGVTTDVVLHKITSVEPPLMRGRNAHVPRDLEAICLMAIEKHPSRRYASASAFADDLRRFLAGQPVLAVTPLPGVRLLRNARRHPARVAAVLLAACLLIGGPIVYLRARDEVQVHRDLAQVETLRAEAQQARAELEAERARLAIEQARLDSERAASATAEAHKWLRRADRIDRFVLSMLTTDDPLVDDKRTTVVDALRRGTEQAHAILGDDDALEAEARVVLGKAFVSLGMFADAAAQFDASLLISRAGTTAEHRRIEYDGLRNGSTALLRLERFEDARVASEGALALARELRGPDSDEVTQCLGNLARALSGVGRNEEANATYREALARYEAAGAPEADVARALTNIALTLPPGSDDERDQLFARAAEIHLRTRSADDYEDRLLLHNALWMRLQTSPDTAPSDDELARLRASVAQLRATNAAGSPRLAGGVTLLAKMLELRDDGDETEIEALLREGRDGFLSLPPSDTRRILGTYWLGKALVRQGRAGEALAFLIEAVDLRQHAPPGFDPSQATMVTTLADALRATGRVDDADALVAALVPAGASDTATDATEDG